MTQLGVKLTVWSSEAECPHCGESRLPLLKLYVWPMDGFPGQPRFEMICDECGESEEFGTIVESLYFGDSPPSGTVQVEPDFSE